MSSLSESSVLAGAAGVSTGYTIDQSIRFNDDDSAYMYRNVDTTFQNKFTYSFWFKGTISRQYFITWRDKRGNGYAYSYIGLFSDYLGVFEYGDHSAHGLVVKADYRTNRLFRDPTAWYHVVVSYDYTNGVATDQIKIYVNGERQTSFSTSTNNTSYAGQSQSTGSPNYLGIGYAYAVAADYADTYMAEINFVDGQALSPSDFGESTSDGIWIPKEYTGTYGNNSYYLKGADSSNLGLDSSGGDKHFTTSGLAANDQRTDSPTNNHCVMNSIVPGSATFSNGDLDLSYSAGSWTTARGTVAIPNNSGIYYYEVKVISHAINLAFGWGDVNMGPNQNNNPATPKFYVYSDNNGKYYSSTDDGTIGDGFTNNDVIGLWYDSDSTTNNLKFYRNGTLQATKSFDFSDTTSIHGHVTHVAPVTQFYSSNSVEYRFDSAYWTNAPAGITSLNAVTTNNIGS